MLTEHTPAVYTITIRGALGNGRLEIMNNVETARKLRSDLTDEQRAEALRIGSLGFESHRQMDWRVERFIPSRENH
jgi:hypothetical protein